MSHEPAPQRPLHRQAGLHRVVAGETVLYLHLAKIDAVFEGDSDTIILLGSGARIRVEATTQDVLTGIIDARAELAREDEAAEEDRQRRLAMRNAAFDADRQGTN